MHCINRYRPGIAQQFTLAALQCRVFSIDSRRQWQGCRVPSWSQAMDKPVLVLHKSSVKATFNTPCELLGKEMLSGQETGGVVGKLGVLTPKECRKLPALV